MMTALGGPGVACSVTRIRRLEAGELQGDERARTEAHLAGCARCQAAQRELAEERSRLAAELPFETFAAGVAEKLAEARRPRRRLPALGLALAAGLAVVAAVPLVSRIAWERASLDGRGGAAFRAKGGAALSLYVRDRGGARALDPDEAVPAGAALRIGIAPDGRRHAAVALVDGDGVAVLHAGEAPAGVLPGAFEWTGGEGTLVLVLDDVPVDPAALAERLARGGAAAASPGTARAEVVVRSLQRSAP